MASALLLLGSALCAFNEIMTNEHDILAPMGILRIQHEDVLPYAFFVYFIGYVEST